VQLEIMYETAQMVFSRHLSELIAERMNSWNNFVKIELSKGGGLLFKYIAKEDKEFMRVNLSKLGGDEFNPGKILEQQADFWSQYLSPKGKAGNETKERCALFMEIYRNFALPEAAKYKFSLQDFLKGLKGFNRSSRGADFFTTKELKWCPAVLQSKIAGSWEQCVQTLAMPHQLDLSVQACLGKKDGLRTVTLSSVLYAIWNRSQEVVREWEM